MPQSPPASPAEKQILEDMVGLAQTEAVSTGNQIEVLTSQLARFQDAQNIFQERYTYWDTYINAYHQERKLLNGVFTVNPVNQNDFNSFANTTGRLYQTGSHAPLRIKEFDNVGFAPTATEAENETNVLTKETAYRNYLLTGFTGTALPFGSSYETFATFTPTSTSLVVHRVDNTNWTMPSPGVLLVYSTGGSGSGVIVEYLVATPNNLNSTVTFTGLKFATGFSNIPANSDVTDSGPTFSNSERTSQVAGSPGFQSRLYAYMQGYLKVANRWLTLLNQEIAQIAAQATAGEDAPDAAYGTSIQTTQGHVQSFVTTPDYSNTGLGVLQSDHTLRSSQIPTRIQWIDDRLIQQTKAYDSRYNYVNKIYNLVDGTKPLIQKFEAQKAQLGIRQAASNYRAAQLSAEIF